MPISHGHLLSLRSRLGWPGIDIGRFATARSAAAQRLNDGHLVARVQRLRQVAYLLAVDEDADVAPYPVLLVDHAETDSRVLALQAGEDLRKCRAARPGLAAVGVRGQGAGAEHLPPDSGS